MTQAAGTSKTWRPRCSSGTQGWHGVAACSVTPLGGASEGDLARDADVSGMAAVAAAPESWCLAAPRRKRATQRRPRREEARACEPQAEPEVDGAAVLRRVREAEEDLRISDFCSSAIETITQCLGEQLEQLQAPMETPAEALAEALGNLHLGSAPGRAGESLVPSTCLVRSVCYGLGNFASCTTARIQLAFLLLLLEKCQEGKRSVDGYPTVFYMPHCGTALYNNLLWSNWSTAALSRTVIIGNSFRGLEERSLTRILQKNYPYIAKVLKGLEELALPQTPQYMDTFNDISVHWFPVSKLERLSRDLWASKEEPNYEDCEDLEIIRKPADRALSHLAGAAAVGAAPEPRSHCRLLPSQ